MTVFVVFLPIFVMLVILMIFRGRSAQNTSQNPDANEPDVFASPEADLDPESDTGEPEGWN